MNVKDNHKMLLSFQVNEVVKYVLNCMYICSWRMCLGMYIYKNQRIIRMKLLSFKANKKKKCRNKIHNQHLTKVKASKQVIIIDSFERRSEKKLNFTLKEIHSKT